MEQTNVLTQLPQFFQSDDLFIPEIQCEARLQDLSGIGYESEGLTSSCFQIKNCCAIAPCSRRQNRFKPNPRRMTDRMTTGRLLRAFTGGCIRIVALKRRRAGDTDHVWPVYGCDSAQRP